MASTRESDDAIVDGYLVRMHGRAWGIALGSLFGIGLFVATNILVLKGGEDVGQHLGLLSHYFWGYDVTFVGSLVGFVWAFVCGYVLGRVICSVYNFAAR